MQLKKKTKNKPKCKDTAAVQKSDFWSEMENRGHNRSNQGIKKMYGFLKIDNGLLVPRLGYL